MNDAVPPEGRRRSGAMPPEGARPSGEVSGSGWFFSGWFFSGAKGSPEEAAALAELRERLGGERFDHFQRSRERDRHPRPLTESERDVIQRATSPVLRDLEASGAIVPEILYQTTGNHYNGGLEGVTTDIGRDGGHGGKVWIPTEECSSAEQVSWAAEALQEWETHELWEAGRPATWPECPQHPSTHPLVPGTDSMGAAVWRCPSTQQVICAIGALGS